MKTKIVITILLVNIILASCIQINTSVPTETIVSPPPFASLTNIAMPSEENSILDIALSPDGRNVAVYAKTGIYIYDTETLEKTTLKEFNNSQYNISDEQTGAIAFSSDGKAIAVSGRFPDTPVQILDLRTGQYLMDIVDIPVAYRVTKIQFSPDNKSIFIRSNYPRTMRCEQADANFALHLIDMSNLSDAIKVFDQDICQTIPMGFVRFTKSNKFVLFVQYMAPKYSVTTVDTTQVAIPDEVEYESLDALSDVSQDGTIYAFSGSQANSRVSILIDRETSKVLWILPYIVKLLDDENRFLVRDSVSIDEEWGLWENENITCHFKGLTSFNPNWDFSSNEQSFTTISPDNDIIIWNVSDCSIKNVLHFGK